VVGVSRVKDFWQLGRDRLLRCACTETDKNVCKMSPFPSPQSRCRFAPRANNDHRSQGVSVRIILRFPDG